MCWIFKFSIGVLNLVLESYILYWRFKFGIGYLNSVLDI